MKMIHDIRYVGLAGEINFSKEPYMYQDTDLFNYNIEYDLNYFPSGRGGNVRRFKLSPQINTLTLGVINRVDVRELVAQLERHFQHDINAKKPAKLFINGSYTECYITSSIKTYFNRFLGINFITLEILRENPVWTTEEEFVYQKVDLDKNPYDLNLIKPPYDFSNFEFTEPAKPLEEANLIKNGWDDFEPYATGHNYVRSWQFSDMSEWNNFPKVDGEVWVAYEWGLFQDITLDKGEYIVRYKVRGNQEDSRSRVDVAGKALVNNVGLDWEVIEHEITVEEKTETLLRPMSARNLNNYLVQFEWISISKKDSQHFIVDLQHLGKGLTRIRTWGGTSTFKLNFSPGLSERKKTLALINVCDVKEPFRLVHVDKNHLITSDTKISSVQDGSGRIRIRALEIDGKIDFVASAPIIYEEEGSMVYSFKEKNDKYHIKTMSGHSKTKMKLQVKKSIFKNEEYTHSLYAENKGESNVVINAEEGIYLDNPFATFEPDEEGNKHFTGVVAEDKLYTTFEIGTENEEDNLDVVIAKPAIAYGDKPFDWPPEEEIVPLRLPTHIPFWITADDSIKYISNNSIGDTLAKITMFGPIKNPTLYIGDKTYRVYEELLENERIEIDQRAKTVTKITASGDRVNVFNLRDKEHSIFEPIPEGENTITQNDDFSYTIVLYHERNEPKWS